MANYRIIKDLAKSKNITLDTLATQSGITPQALSKIMREESTKVSTLEKIADVLGVPVTVFFDAPTAGGGDSAGRDVNKGNAKVLHIEQLNADQLAEVARLMRDREGGEGDQGVTEQGAALRADANPTNNTLAQLRQEIAQLRQDNAALRQDNDRLLKENALQAELLQLYRKG